MSSGEQNHSVRVQVTVNGEPVDKTVDTATTLLDFVRELTLTGAHAGCEHGVCGACTVLVDGEPVRSCIVFAAQMHSDMHVETVESLGSPECPSRLQVEFSQAGGLQCGFCTPGFLMVATALLRRNSRPCVEEIRESVSSNVCRCTGYEAIVDAIDKSARGEVPSVDDGE